MATKTENKAAETVEKTAKAPAKTAAKKAPAAKKTAEKPAEKKPVEKKPAEKKPVEKKPAEKKPVEKKSERIRIRIKGYEAILVDQTAQKIIETAQRTGAVVSGPIPLPTKKEIVTILRAVHKYKDSREQFERRTHKRLIDVIKPTAKTADALSNIELPVGVDIEIQL